jgi:tetratricopeptide (TPR) repeat protein
MRGMLRAQNNNLNIFLMSIHRPALAVIVVLLCALPALAQRGGEPPSETARQAQQLIREGKLDEALARYNQELEATPASIAAHSGAGVVLDLLGRTAEARTHFTKAITAAATPAAKAAAQRAMAMSYGFDGDCRNTEKYERMVVEYWETMKDAYQQGEMLNEAARVCIDSGDFDAAQKLYLAGRDAGLKEPNVSADRAALWNFRTEHALARLAARRQQPAEAAKHVAAAKALLDGNVEMAKQQAVFLPYLTGYVAFYAGDYKTAIVELHNASQQDPFIQVLMAQTYEQLGDNDKALELYRKAAATTGHNPPAAFARPFATRKLAVK